ncbi:MAPEG family protein [Bradyrhizobium sediminis]|uniref:MAPEG family protein n=2 Tax=Bradyrhizobium sediminis TaxID=2840469 RepID=A0A975NJC8_9BRAD|nr:MAPEG family protein [Bradyrhizobium sediminis]QWG15611.1 MAPEG family protein [Bradyrhizobium sediminis]
MQPLPTEIVMLGLGTMLLLVQLFLQSISSTVEMGGDYKAGPRDEPRVVQGIFAGRADRAFRNLLETFPIFAALALALVVTGRNGGLGTLGAEAWVVTRVLYVPLYVIQIPYARSLVWLVSVLALVAMLVRLFQ